MGHAVEQAQATLEQLQEEQAHRREVLTWFGKIEALLTIATGALQAIERAVTHKPKTWYPKALCDASQGNVLDYRGRRHLLVLSPSTFDMLFDLPGAVSVTITQKVWTEIHFPDQIGYSTNGLGTDPTTLTQVIFLATDEVAGL